MADRSLPRTATPHRTAHPLVCGRFDQRGEYAAWRPRGVEDFLLIMTVAGQGRLTLAGVDWITRPGDVVLISPGSPHDYGLEDELRHWELIWAHFIPRPHWSRWLNWPAIGPGVGRLTGLSGEAEAGILAALDRMHRRAQSPGPGAIDLAMNALEEALIRCGLANPEGPAARLDRRISAAAEYAASRLGDDLSVAALARAAGMSPSRFAHLFAAQAQATPQRFVEQLRLQRAAQLLEMTDLPLKRIASMVGFAGPFYFSQRFRRHFGRSPGAYRRRALAEGESAGASRGPDAVDPGHAAPEHRPP